MTMNLSNVLRIKSPTITFYCHMMRRCISNTAIQKKRIQMFEREKKRQSELITEVEKIIVTYREELDHSKKVSLVMNKDISTPYDCSRHISELIKDRSVCAEVNGEVWDLCQPLKENCELDLLHFKEADPYYSNKAFWRSCSVMLGCVLETLFKDQHHVNLCSFPRPDVKTGSFVYDAAISDLGDWKPSLDDMRSISAAMVKLALENHYFERLDVDVNLALEMFEDNKYKSAQIPHIAASSSNGTSVTIYKLKNFLEISRGPMMGRTGHMGRCTITNFIPFDIDGQSLYRIQGIALPSVLRINAFSYSILEERARKLNPGSTPAFSQWIETPSQKFTDVQ